MGKTFKDQRKGGHGKKPWLPRMPMPKPTRPHGDGRRRREHFDDTLDEQPEYKRPTYESDEN